MASEISCFSSSLFATIEFLIEVVSVVALIFDLPVYSTKSIFFAVSDLNV